MNELALFSGAGGGILGGKLLGWRTVCAVEIDPYCREVLLRRQRDGVLPLFPIWDDVRTFDGRPWESLVDVISAGFPCQPFSVAGKRAGEGDERNMWPDTIRIIRDVRPRFCLLENVPGLLSSGYFGQVLGDLAASGYDARWDCFSAASIGAPHRRDRLWIVATDSRSEQHQGRGDENRRPPSEEFSQPNLSDSQCDGIRDESGRRGWTDREGSPVSPDDSTSESLANASRLQQGRPEQRAERERIGESGQSGLADSEIDRRESRRASDTTQIERRRELNRGGFDADELADPTSARSQTGRSGKGGSVRDESGRTEFERRGGDGTWWEFEPDVGRVAHWVANRVHRLKAIGNGQVPGVAAKAWSQLSNTK